MVSYVIKNTTIQYTFGSLYSLKKKNIQQTVNICNLNLNIFMYS